MNTKNIPTLTSDEIETIQFHQKHNDDIILVTNIVYKPTKKYLSLEEDEKPPLRLFVGVSGDWIGERWFTNQSLMTKQIIRSETGFTPESWDEDIFHN